MAKVSPGASKLQRELIKAVAAGDYTLDDVIFASGVVIANALAHPQADDEQIEAMILQVTIQIQAGVKLLRTNYANTLT